MVHLGSHGWKDVKKELMQKWHELTENDLDKTRGERRSLMDLLERKIGMPIEEASEHIEQIAERYHLFEEPHEAPTPTPRNPEEKIFELSPQQTEARKIRPNKTPPKKIK